MLTLTAFITLASTWQASYTLRWAALAGPGVVYLLWLVWRGLPENRRPGQAELLHRLGPGNLLTWLRGLWIAWLAGFLFLPRPDGWLAWLPGLLYLPAALADILDGYLARRTGMLTRLGEQLDLRLDGLGVLLASALAVQYGQVPAWYLLVGLARYLFLAGIWLLGRLGRPVYDLPPSANRRRLAGLQMAFLGASLTTLFAPPHTILAAYLFGLLFLAGFVRDWLAVSGVFRRDWKPTPAGSPRERWESQGEA